VRLLKSRGDSQSRRGQPGGQPFGRAREMPMPTLGNPRPLADLIRRSDDLVEQGDGADPSKVQSNRDQGRQG